MSSSGRSYGSFDASMMAMSLFACSFCLASSIADMVNLFGARHFRAFINARLDGSGVTGLVGGRFIGGVEDMRSQGLDFINDWLIAFVYYSSGSQT